MKATIKTPHVVPAVKKFTYPCLLVNLRHGFVILATSKHIKANTVDTVSGTVVGNGPDEHGYEMHTWKVGHHSDTWSLEGLEEFNGKIELENE